MIRTWVLYEKHQKETRDNLFISDQKRFMKQG